MTADVLAEITAERARQDAKWGQQNHPDGTDDHWLATDNAQVFKNRVEDRAEAGDLTWLDILREEVEEAAAEVDAEKLRTELIQVAAVATAWVEAIDRRSNR